jgi:predicted DNA-binding transcriptional regulator AlpA
MSEPRMVAVENIVGLQQAAERLGVSLTTLDNYIQGIRGKHHPFPEPIAFINSRTKVWDWNDIQQWSDTYKPARGGAPTGERNGKRTKPPKLRGITGSGAVKTERGWRNVS